MKHCLVLISVAILMACSTHRWPDVPNPSETGVPGELQKQWWAAHPGSRKPGMCAPRDAPTGISEIALERTPCFGFCPTYEVRVTSDGSVEYHGQANIPRVGHRKGWLDPEYFQVLSLLAVDIGFFGMADEYDCLITDSPTVYVSVVRNGVRKTIRHYAPFRAGPPRLRMFEDAVDEYLSHVEWHD